MSRVLDWIDSKPSVEKRVTDLKQAYGEEAFFFNLADNTRLTRRQAPDLFASVATAAAGLGTEFPEIFLDTTPVINAIALPGTERSILVVTTKLVDTLPSAEQAFVAAHELGHVLADHTFFRGVASSSFPVIELLLSAIPGGSALALMLQWLLHDWYRKGELSADRAALVATGDLDVAQSVFIRMAGGSDAASFDRELFLEQARQFRETLYAREASMNGWDRIVRIAATLLAENGVRAHPWPALRFLELTEWAESEHYEAIRDGYYDYAAFVTESTEIERREDTTDDAFDDLTTQVRMIGQGLTGAWRATQSRWSELAEESANDRPEEE